MKIAWGVLLAMVLLSSAAAEIRPAPGTQPIRPVYDQSDVVCLCSIKSVEITHGEPAADFAVSKIIRRQVTMRAEARQIYKNDAHDAREFQIKYMEEVGPASPLRTILETGDMALLFLKSKSSDTYEFADRFLGVTQFTGVPTGSGGTGLAGLEAALAFLAREHNEAGCLSALRLLQGFDSLSQDSIAAVNNLITSENPQIAFTALAILLKTRTPDAVKKLEYYLENYKGSVEPIALLSIGAELGDITSEKALPTIEALTSSRFLSIRDGAMESLRKMKNPQAASVLVQRLDDPNSAIQYLAVIALAETLGKFDGDYAPSMYLFDKKPQYYVELWKKWWAEEGKARYPSN